ncbi:MAG: 50S ribosomal protein L22 [Planctomycetes bacterium]|nr:50S ribosomal protein L22 [Planctomycetota bacterium]
MQFQATLRYARTTARKCGLVARMIRGRDVNSALEILRVTPRRPARYLHKLVQSAMANATSLSQEKDLGVDAERLVVREVRVGGGPIMKRWGSAPQGRGVLIRKRTAHLTVILEPLPEPARKEKGAKGAKAEAPKPTPSGEAAPKPAATKSEPPPAAPPAPDKEKK